MPRIASRIAAITPSATLVVDSKAKALKADGQPVIGFGAGEPDFPTPAHIVEAARQALNDPKNFRYSPSAGLPELKQAIAEKTLRDSGVQVEPSQVLVTNGGKQAVYEAFAAVIDTGDDVLLPAPYWTTYPECIRLAGGNPIEVFAGSEQDYKVTVEQLEAAYTPATKALLFVSPSNPTGSVYTEEETRAIGQWALAKGIFVFTDEIYEKIIYDGAEAINLATLTGDDVLCLTFSGLSKAYRVCGYRAGWVAITGPKHEAANYIEGITLLASMRLCSNVPAQHAIQTALGGYQSIDALVAPGGRLHEQRDVAYRMLNEIDGISCNQSDGALYLFPKVDTEKFNIVDDEKFMLDLLKEQKILFSHGGAFNWHKPDHFRLVFLPDVQTLTDALNRLGEFLSDYKQRA